MAAETVGRLYGTRYCLPALCVRKIVQLTEKYLTSIAVCTELWPFVFWPHDVTVCKVLHVTSAIDRRLLMNRSHWRPSK